MKELKKKHHRKHTHLTNGNYPLVIDQAFSSSFAESYRTLHTNIHYSFNRKPARLLMVTSSIPKEGKTLTTINLALTAAESGQKVLLVDTDLRIPSIFKAFGHDRQRGLTNILIDVYNTDLTRGDLSLYGLGDLFHILNIQGKNGSLSISENGDRYHLLFQDGRLIDIQWENRPEEARLGTILVESGKISPTQKIKALKRQARTQERLGSILLNMNLISAQDLEGPLRLHTSEALHRLYSLKRGTFCFQDKNLSENHYSISANGADQTKGIQEITSWQENIPFIDQKISSYLQDTPVDNLKVLNSGPIPSNATELLSSQRMSELINILKKKFNTIIFDSPPLNSVSDACILASKVDGVIMVVSVGRVNRRGVQKAKQQLETAGAKICGVILNRLDMKKDGYYYYGYYRYYHYGYYHKNNQSSAEE